MLLRIEPMPQQESVGDRVAVSLPQGQQPASSRERQDSFGAFKERNGAQT